MISIAGIRRTRARWISYAMLTLIASVLLAGLWVTFRTIEAERIQREQVAKTNQILLELRNVNEALLSAETGQRGYLITLDRRYLDPYRSGSTRARPAVERLKALLGPAATRRQRELVTQIEQQVQTKLDELQGTVELVEEGKLRDARLYVLTDRGQLAMERLRASMREMERIETDILARALTQTAATEARTLPLLGLVVFTALAFILFAIGLATRTAKAETEAAQAAALGEARDRADLLARELNHRVKNLFAVILAIVQMSGRGKPEAAEVVDGISTRIRALLTAHEVTQGALDKPVASLEALVETTLSPYRSADKPAVIEGPPVTLPAKCVTPLGLVLHELTTNAVKYGAWAHGGTVRVAWQLAGPDIAIAWREDGADAIAAPEREGFGSLLMKSAARQLGGTIERNFTPTGVEVAIRFPADTAVTAA